eukprot:5560321-Prorocentrum_lima.AAC.1
MLQFSRHTAHKTTFAMNASSFPHAWACVDPAPELSELLLILVAHIYLAPPFFSSFSRVERSGKN